VLTIDFNMSISASMAFLVHYGSHIRSKIEVSVTFPFSGSHISRYNFVGFWQEGVAACPGQQSV
jgi:hypothetical protein